jgi:hypothetical protein
VHLDKACKNEKLQRMFMCSVANCCKIFAGEAQLKYHYKVAHPEAIFEIDFMPKGPKESRDAKSFIDYESERT